MNFRRTYDKLIT